MDVRDDDRDGRDDSDHGTASDDPIDRLGRSAGAELRRPPSAGALARVDASARRRRAARHAVVGGSAAAAIVAAAVTVLAVRDGNDGHDGATVVSETTPTTRDETTVPSAPASTVAAATTSAPLSTVAAVVTAAPVATTPPEPIEIGPGTELVWGDGAVLGAYVDGRFVAHDAATHERFVAPPLPAPGAYSNELPPEPPTSMLDRDAAGDVRTGQYVMYDEGCGAIIASPAASGFADAESRGWLATTGHPFATLDDSVAVVPEGLDAALLAAGVAAADLPVIERLTPTVSMDGDPMLETLVFRHDPELVAAGTARETLTWFAVWDPDTAELVTIAGDPTGTATPFAVNDEGPIDVDGDGLLETTIVSGLHVDLVRLTDAVTLASAERCPVTLDVTVSFDGFGADELDYTVTMASSEQSFSGRTIGEGGTGGPFTFDIPLGRTGTYVVVDTPAGPAQWEILFSAGRNVAHIALTPQSAAPM